MAKKVFRIHDNQGPNTSDWFSSVQISSNLIDSIHTDGGDGKKLPTSIPSPFARIDLVRTAFKTVAEKSSQDIKNLDGLERNGRATATDNHKLISDALDIGQIFFNYDKHNEDLELLEWDKESSLDVLIKGNKEQKHLGKTLKLFIDQDRAQYNFDKMNKIYILIYKHIIIGGTSPRTLFFAAPDASETGIKFGQDIMLDDHLYPLYKRDKEYIKYLYSLSKVVPNFNRDFREFNQYLNATLNKFQKTDIQMFNEIKSLDYIKYFNSLKDVVYNGNPGQPLEVISKVPIKQFIEDPIIIEKNSDFVINTSKQIEGLKPLVLPIEPLSLKYIYTLDMWDVNTIVPVYDPNPIQNRTLPDQKNSYPYLTMNDFLEDFIVKLPYKIEESKFLTFGAENYLLPIKKLFFDYFSVEDIENRNLIEISEVGGVSVEVKIRIPIKKGSIEYKKIYLPEKTASDESQDLKTGTIIKKPFALSIYPFVASQGSQITYNVSIADIHPTRDSSIEVGFYDSTDSNYFDAIHSVKRADDPFGTKQFVINKNFDAISFNVENVENIIIPRWSIYRGHAGDNYEFAIDFGTTNSHIEYKIQGQGSERAFDITESDEQIAFLMSESVDVTDLDIDEVVEAEEYITQEVVSKRFGQGELRKSPFRTCLIQNLDINYNIPTKLFSDANIAFDYEKRSIRKYLKPYTDLKWSIGDSDDKYRLELYIEELLVLCKNKVLKNNGNIANTKVTWFYPVSMSTNHLNMFRKIWQEKFSSIFEIDDRNLFDYPESIAPFYYYKEKGGIRAMAKPSISIDIGGGTSDVMIFADNEPKLITSFKFAGNSIFGDGFNGNINDNGFVNKYYQKIKDILIQNDLKGEVAIIDKIYKDYSSSVDLINFLFSLKDNKNVVDKQLDINFSKLLEQDDNFKIVFLIFYTSIIYHIAEMMKIKGLDTPRNILFSGTGSKTIKMLDNSGRLASLTELFEAIFNKVYGVENSKITVKTDPQPKEITCKGGFYIDDNVDIIKHTQLVEVNVGNLSKQRVQKRNDISDEVVRYRDVDGGYIDGVIENVKNFYGLFVDLNKEINFKDEFGLSQSSLDVFEGLKSDDLIDYIMSGMEAVKADSSDDEPISETLFFYPLIGKLNEVATKVSENEQN